VVGRLAALFVVVVFAFFVIVVAFGMILRFRSFNSDFLLYSNLGVLDFLKHPLVDVILVFDLSQLLGRCRLHFNSLASRVVDVQVEVEDVLGDRLLFGKNLVVDVTLDVEVGADLLLLGLVDNSFADYFDVGFYFLVELAEQLGYTVLFLIGNQRVD